MFRQVLCVDNKVGTELGIGLYFLPFVCTEGCQQQGVGNGIPGTFNRELPFLLYFFLKQE